ncbi:uncharacterized protein LOC105698532 isoform X2 [Orussus abietinus]|uniref:uncharacterized protein LOC105698532 isoform X2 n=1 Tax=Orussus abietinus TaxID=222816 RepID=UPI00062528C6|nr:uncharacterized protein LOC105698532 isoform X2 [Orussus abietinus]
MIQTTWTFWDGFRRSSFTSFPWGDAKYVTTKQVVQRLRGEVESFKAENANGAKVSIASLLGLNNNNHITNDNEAGADVVEVKDVNGFERRSSKDDYEDEALRNGDEGRTKSNFRSDRSYSVETVSCEDDVIEVSMDENSSEKREDDVEEDKPGSYEQLTFLGMLGLVTTARHNELQSKRAERKRRSTANPQFVYSTWEIPTKRKKYSYMQSAGNAPQTRQTTARLNGPSPPPGKVSLSKSVSPPTRNLAKSLIPNQKSGTRPNILRSVAESKLFVGKNKRENGLGQARVSASRPVQSVGGKTVHIPGLPSSLTIERIEGETTVCISCRNPGTLTVCENCSANYHVSCHTTSPAPPRTCPKCSLGKSRDDCMIIETYSKKDEELATAAHASGTLGKAGEDPEVHKAARGFHKVDATQKRKLLSSALGINQLPSSTFLIPISPNAIAGISQQEAAAAAATTTDLSSAADPEQHQPESGHSYSSILVNRLSQQPSVAYVQPEPQVSYTYQLPIAGVQSEKHQSYLIVKKISEPGPVGRAGRSRFASAGSAGFKAEARNLSLFDYQLSSSTGHNAGGQSEGALAHSTVYVDKFPRRFSDAIGRKKPNPRAVPALNRLVHQEKPLPVSPADHLLESPALLVERRPKAGAARSKLDTHKLRASRRPELLLSYNAFVGAGSSDHLEAAGRLESEETGPESRGRPRGGGLLHSLFASYNPADSLADRPDEPAGSSVPELPRDGPVPPDLGEHVKLEEAHLPAPPGAELVRESKVEASSTAGDAPRGGSSSSPHGGPETRNSAPHSKVRKRKDSMDTLVERAGDIEFIEEFSNSRLNPGVITYERKHTVAKLIGAVRCLKESARRLIAEPATPPTADSRGDFLDEPVDADVAPPASGGRRGSSADETDSGGSLAGDPSAELRDSTTEESSDGAPGEEDRDESDRGGPTERQDLGRGASGRGSCDGNGDGDRVPREEGSALGMGAVSRENLQVLEEFESAMLETDEGPTANS